MTDLSLIERLECCITARSGIILEEEDGGVILTYKDNGEPTKIFVSSTVQDAIRQYVEYLEDQAP